MDNKQYQKKDKKTEVINNEVIFFIYYSPLSFYNYNLG